MGFAEGISDVVQGGIRVDHLGRAQIMDFALASANRNQCPTCGTVKLGNYVMPRWTAPEVMNEVGPYTDKEDVFSFAMVMVEVSHGECYIATFV